ncbi:hypothetical protein [Streptomyces sp. NBC_01022]|uniref:hypothetical protein n=1 Tax=Streptomyces sp. NBC_01022 TaxID=2903723 RepID=UPI002DDAEEC7|nr:hypothetical protein [Streptomyces sp. NBC_01022]WRZ84056.1 hypothetical protein OG316_29270 [Streptomyces sp. NBC_01022]
MTLSGIPPYPDQHTGMPRRPSRTPRWVVILIVVMVSLVVLTPVALVVGFFYAWQENHKDMRFPSWDVSVASCRRDAVTGGPVAEVRVTSQAKRRGTYTVYLTFRDPWGKDGGEGRSEAAGRRTVVLKDLAVGATATREVAGPVPVRGRPQCVVADATFLSTELAEASKSATP